MRLSVRGLKTFSKHAGLGVLGVSILTAACFQARLDLAATIPLYLLVVVFLSLTGDFPAAAVTAAVSAAYLDYFFTQPLFALYIRNPLNVLALVSFIFTALVITRLVSQVREQGKLSSVQKERLDRLYQLSQQLLAIEPAIDGGEGLLAAFRRLFGVSALCIFDTETSASQHIGESEHDLERKTRDAYIAGSDCKDPPVTVRCLRRAGKLIGAVGFENLADGSEVAPALAALTAAFVERTHAFRQASEAAASTQAESFRSAILDALAHEFKTPLATILTAAGGLREAGPLLSSQIELADTVENEAARLSKLTTRLLRTARLDREDIKPRMERMEMSTLLARMTAQYASRFPDRHIVMKRSGGSYDVFGDPELLRLALAQLVENACKYSNPGSFVTVELGRDGDFVGVNVSNTGSAIDENERSRIFDRFYRGANVKSSTSGSGLGLYVARKIAVVHKGSLELEAEKNKQGGVTFHLRIPSLEPELTHAVASK